MGLVALIEITRNTDGSVPASLIRALYCASGDGVIALALRNIHWTEVDAALDTLVPTMPLSIPGLRYIDVRDEPAILAAACEAQMVISATDDFAALIDRRSVPPTLRPQSWRHMSCNSRIKALTRYHRMGAGKGYMLTTEEFERGNAEAFHKADRDQNGLLNRVGQH